MRIFLVRHGMSRANVDWSENRRVADHAIELTDEGKRQAREAGRFLAEYFRGNLLQPSGGVICHVPKVRLWHSPYTRTRQTATEIVETCRLHRHAQGFKTAMTSNSWREKKGGDTWFVDRAEEGRPVPHAREHFLLHEQQFGIFDGLSDEERAEQFPRETEYYEKCKRFEGKVWAKFPMGESRIDVARRMHQAFGTFKRDEEKHRIENIVVVGHGTTNRCFTMAWMRYAPEWLEKEPNPRNCSVRLIEDGVDKGYVFEGFDNPDGYKHVVNRESEE
jgi:2,3-bisphosphoglycerate-dependent phosphoglycerate mutase